MTLPPERVWRLRLRGVNAYLVDCDVLTLVDAGTPWDVDRIRERVEQAGFEIDDVERVLLTHFDVDHVGALAALDLDATVYVADPDARYLTGTAQPPLGNHKGAIQRLADVFLTRPDLDVEVVADGDEIGPFVAYRTPGHTPGHTAYVHGEYGVAFVGDLVRELDGDLVESGWFMSYDTDDNEASIRHLADHTVDVDVIAVGHGDPIRENGGDALRRLADSL